MKLVTDTIQLSGKSLFREWKKDNTVFSSEFFTIFVLLQESPPAGIYKNAGLRRFCTGFIFLDPGALPVYVFIYG